MDHITHTMLLWIVAGMGIASFVLWLAMVASSEGERLGPELDRLLAERREASAEVSSPSSLAGDRFRLLGDPEYGLFLGDLREEDAADSAASAA
jgi:hypothetical protein